MKNLLDQLIELLNKFVNGKKPKSNPPNTKDVIECFKSIRESCYEATSLVHKYFEETTKTTRV